MRRIQLISTVLAAAALCGCGNGSPKLQHVTVHPAVALAATVPQQQLQFTAQGTFDNNTTRMLTLADGILWSSSHPKVATIDAAGIATCVMPGASTIVATAPVTSHRTFSSTGSTTTSAVVFPGGTAQGSPTVSGSATLTCGSQ